MMRQRTFFDVPVAGIAWILLLVCAYIYTIAKRVSWRFFARAFPIAWT